MATFPKTDKPEICMLCNKKLSFRRSDSIECIVNSRLVGVHKKCWKNHKWIDG